MKLGLIYKRDTNLSKLRHYRAELKLLLSENNVTKVVFMM